MRYVYGITSALLAGGTALALVTQSPLGAQVAQNESSEIAKVVPRSGAPESFADLVEHSAAVVKSLQAEVTWRPAEPLPGREPITQEQQGGGSGFLISADGYIVTNNHVIRASARRGRQSGHRDADQPKEYKATIAPRRRIRLALLKIDAAACLS